MDSNQVIYNSKDGHHQKQHNQFYKSYLNTNKSAIAVVDEDGNRFDSEASLIAKLQVKLDEEHVKQLTLEKENHTLKIRVQELEKELEDAKTKLIKGVDVHEFSFRAIRNQLAATIDCLSSTSSPKQLKNKNNKKPKRKHIVENEQGASTSGITRLVFIHKCDECDVFSTKSDASMILHKINHAIVEEQDRFQVDSFTTRKPNTKDIYKCPVCVDEHKMTLHQVYFHI